MIPFDASPAARSPHSAGGCHIGEQQNSPGIFCSASSRARSDRLRRSAEAELPDALHEIVRRASLGAQRREPRRDPGAQRCPGVGHRGLGGGPALWFARVGPTMATPPFSYAPLEAKILPLPRSSLRLSVPAGGQRCGRANASLMRQQQRCLLPECMGRGTRAAPALGVAFCSKQP
jgi:hypothetical protein